MEQLTKNQAVATSQEAVQNQNEPQLRDENAHNDKSVHGVLNPTYQAGLRRDAVQPDIEAERKKRDEIEAGKSYCSRRFGGATCDDKSAQIYARVDAKGEPLKATSYMAVGFYVAKYVNKKSDMDLAAKGLGAKEWNSSLKTKLSLLPKKLFRIRMSRNFGMKMLTMTNLSTECLIQLTKLGYDATPFNQILKQNAKREMRLRLGKVTVADVLAAQPVTTNLLKFMRASIKMIGVSN